MAIGGAVFLIKNILLLLLLMLMVGYSPLQPSSNPETFSSPYASTETSITSPSGQYTLTLIAQTREEIPEDGVRQYTLSVHDLSTDSVTLVKTEYRVRDHVRATWDDNQDRIWVDSSDTGIYFWDYDEDLSHWTEFLFIGQEDAQLPDAFIRD